MERQIADVGRVSVDRIGGIGSTEVTIAEGVTVLAGRNATNRTSLLRSIMGALGSDDVSLRADADEGRVELTVDGERYTRRLVRRNGTVRLDGSPYLEDATSADLFAFLLEDNEARRAVARGGDLREIVMRPVDTEQLRAETERLAAERDEIDERLRELDRIARELADAESRRAGLRRELAETEAELEEKRAELDALDGTGADARPGAGEVEDALEALRESRSELESVRRTLRTHRESVDALETDLEKAREALADLPEPAPGALDEIEGRIETLRDHRRTVESTVARLGKVVQFNEGMLDDSGPDPGAVLSDDPDSVPEPDPGASVTDRLLEEGSVTCWTCGSEVGVDAIEGTLDELRELRTEHVRTREEITEELDGLKDRRREIERTAARRSELEERIEQIEAEIDEREAAIDELEARREELSAEVDRREASVGERRSEQQDALLERHREISRLEVEAERLRGELEEWTAEIESLEDELAERDRLEDRRETVVGRLEECRTRIDRLETRAVEAFNTHIEAVLDALAYENVERVWIEARDREVRDGRHTVERRVFELHVVRSGESGAAYEDTVEHLSESEREVVGLVFALAGYLAHEVYEEVPFMLLDSLEALDAGRIAALIDYLAEYPDYLVVALLPEDAAALDDDYRRVTGI